jgi:hypothetical protein
LANFLKIKGKKRKISTRKTFFSPPKKWLLFVQTSNPNIEQEVVNHNCPRHPNLDAHGPIFDYFIN